jgi:hypothetical protein
VIFNLTKSHDPDLEIDLPIQLPKQKFSEGMFSEGMFKIDFIRKYASNTILNIPSLNIPSLKIFSEGQICTLRNLVPGPQRSRFVHCHPDPLDRPVLIKHQNAVFYVFVTYFTVPAEAPKTSYS